MKEKYNITGMTCGGCKASVEKYLNKVNAIESVVVDLEKNEIEVTSSKDVNIKVLQNALPEKYTITVHKSSIKSTVLELDLKTEKSKFQQLKPLFLILFYITIGSNLIAKDNWNINDVMLNFMGLFYIVFSFFKFLDLKGFPESFSMYDPLAKRFSIYGWVYPFIETTLGLFFLMRFEIEIALVITLVILGITTFGVIKTLLDKKSIRCACLGTALKLPMTEATFIENAIMIVMAITMLTKLI